MKLPRESSAGTEMAQLVCGGCHTLLMYIRGATSVQCSCCHTVNLAMEGKSCDFDSCTKEEEEEKKILLSVYCVVWKAQQPSNSILTS